MRARLCDLRMTLSVVFLFGLATTCPAQEKTDWSSLDASINSSMKEWKVPGVAVTIVKDQSIVYMKGFGVREMGKSDPVTPDTLFDIGSCTKAFTSAAIAILVDEGKMRWDGKVNEYIPFFHLQDSLADENVTIRDLLTHRTGVPSTDLLWYVYPQASREQLIRRLADAHPNAGFRTKFQYQNMMYVAAGYAVGQVAHSTWDDFVRTRIFQPLGMSESDTSSIDAEKSPDHASPHEENPDGTVKVIPWHNIDNAGPAGSINSSARDMAKWMTMQLNDGMYDGKQLISKKNVREMQIPQMVIDSEGEIPTVFFPDSTQLSYGLGWFVQQYRGHQLILHAGDIDGFSTMVVLIPEIHMSYFVVINLGSFYRQVLSYQIADRLLGLPDAGWDAHFKKLEADFKTEEKSQEETWESKRTPGTHPSRDLAAYVGTYHNSEYGEAEIVLENQKLALHFHSIKTDLDHFQYDTFVVKFGGKTRLTFCLDSDGNVASFKVDDLEFKRIAEPAPSKK
ncbi:MAG: serine hydrolase [Candidatus Acidiferrales bacterium]|jgi:CubicO group peptidase (beta-lactamase class C family)